MIRTVELALLPPEVSDEATLRRALCAKLGWTEEELTHWRILRRSVDARGSRPLFRLRVEAFRGELPEPEPSWLAGLPEIASATPVLIVGAGPAGYFGALELIARGFRPIVLDRGKDVRARRRDLRAIQQEGIVNPQSNYCFGEGGAGTYSDGKLYTRSHKRGNIEKTLRILVEHGANPDILVDAHPHIGSNKLPGVVQNIRQTILDRGGEVHFNSEVCDLILHGGRLEGVRLRDGREYRADAVILATGHSARDMYALLQRRGIRLVIKPFALGVRIEHPQALIDQLQYGQSPREKELPAASYKLVAQVEKRGVFSFCMCPGGLVVPAATAPGEIVVNGMSMSRRDSAFANSGTVVAVEREDLAPWQDQGVFAGLAFQRQVEQEMFRYGDGSQRAPAQRLPDFVRGKLSEALPKSSYIPGLYPAPLHTLLPEFIYRRLRRGIREFDKKMRGYFTDEAVVIATESRTSAPLRIPRDRETLMHEDVEGLFPAGEGAGYAGGILSAAMDGQNVAAAVEAFLLSRITPKPSSRP